MGLSFKDQLAALQEDEPKCELEDNGELTAAVDLDSAYADLDGHELGNADRSHYEDVG
jgi:hypothetical protein